MVYIAFLSLAVAIVASIMYIRLRRRVKKHLSEGVFLSIGPKERETLKEITYRRFAIVHNMYEMLFLTCGNSPKYNGKLADYLAQEYTSGRVGALVEGWVVSWVGSLGTESAGSQAHRAVMTKAANARQSRFFKIFIIKIPFCIGFVFRF